MMSFLKAIVSPSYWFTHQHPVPEAWVNALLVLFGLFVVTGLLTGLFARRQAFLAPVRTLLRRVSALGWTMGLLGYALLFFSVQQVAFFSVRLLYLVWGIVTLIWLYKVLAYAFFSLPARFQEQKEKAAREKYLPKAAK